MRGAEQAEPRADTILSGFDTSTTLSRSRIILENIAVQPSEGKSPRGSGTQIVEGGKA